MKVKARTGYFWTLVEDAASGCLPGHWDLAARRASEGLVRLRFQDQDQAELRMTLSVDSSAGAPA